jgi:hypothetical protein
VREVGDITLDALLKTAGKINPADLARLVEGMKLEDIAKAIDLLQSLPAGGARDQLLDAIIMQWAKINPKGFLDKMSSITSPRMREDGVVAALRAWGAQDPAAALGWLKNNPGGVSNNVMQARYASAIAGIVANDPTAALNFYNSLGPNDRNLAQIVLQGIVDGFASIGRFSDAVGLIQQLPAGFAQNQALTMLMAQWAAASPGDAAAWVATLTDPMQKSRYLQTIAQAWAQSDPVGAAKWAAELDLQMLANPNAATGGQRGGRGGRGGPGGAAAGTLLASTITQWAQVDLDGVASYLNTLSASPSKDQAVAAFLRQAGTEDPEGSLAWIKSISDPNLQQQSLGNLVRNWQQTDPLGYQAYLATLSPTDAAALQNAAGGGFGGGRGGRGGAGGAGGNAGQAGAAQLGGGNQFVGNGAGGGRNGGGTTVAGGNFGGGAGGAGTGFGGGAGGGGRGGRGGRGGGGGGG